MKALSIQIVCIFLIMSGCIMPESNHVEPDYYLLSDIKNDHNGSKENTEVTFYLREIELPRYLKDSRMVTRPTVHTIEFRENKRWGEPLEDGIARAISMNMQNRVASSQFSLFPNRRKDGLRWDISISFASFERASDHIIIDAKWLAKDKSGGGVAGNYSSSFPLDKNSSETDEINTFNLALYELSKSILSSLTSS